ncbi:MAG: class I SAM-dependent methyltransferase [Rhodospirillales bacterium]|nr:class I SAM-dependent methyltransferase [Rhodospirillales bacterium]
MSADEAQAAAIAGRVRAQYERFPYPHDEARISDDVLAGREFPRGCPKREFALYWPTLPERDDLDILVAGCGSNQAAILGATLPNARIVAIDISAASIARSEALARAHGVANVTHLHKSLLEAGDLGRDFDYIVSSGVLHHLPDPDAGFRALRGVLRPMGSMLIMLYGRYGRDGVYLFQDLFRRLGVTPETATADDLRHVADLVKNAPATHPITLRRAYFGDPSEAETVDLFLHPRDVAYTVPEIHDTLARTGLALQAWYYRAHYSPRCTPLVDHPFYERIERLPERERFAIGELYRAAVHQHFFVACRGDRPRATYVPDFADDKLFALVPQLRPSFVAEPRPDGQPGLRCRLGGHLFKILQLNFDPIQSRVISLVDGRRSVGAIAGELQGLGDAATVRAYLRGLIEDLWEFDFVFLRFPG